VKFIRLASRVPTSAGIFNEVIVAVGPRASAASGPSRDALGASTSIAVPRAIITSSFVALLTVFGLLFANMAIKVARVTVIVSSDGLLARNLRGGVHTEHLVPK
jgi:hypothetical protein